MQLSPLGEIIVALFIALLTWSLTKYFNRIENGTEKTNHIETMDSQIGDHEKQIADLYNKFNELNKDIAKGKAELMEHFLQFYKDAYKR